MISLEKSRKILKLLSKALKIIAYLLFAFAIANSLFIFQKPIVTHLILSILLFLVGLNFFYLGYGLSLEEKWAWVVGFIIFSFGFVFSLFELILWKANRLPSDSLTNILSGLIIQVLFLILFFYISPVFKEKIEKVSHWFNKKGFKEVVITAVLIYSLGIISLAWWVPKEMEIQKDKIQKQVEQLEEFKEFKLGSTELPSSKDFIDKETANWKTYQNPIPNFFIKYPTNCILAKEYIQEERFYDSTPLISYDMPRFKGYLVVFKGGDNIMIEIQRGDYYYGEFEKKEKLTYQELINLEEKRIKQEKKDLIKDIRKEKIYLDGNPAIRITFLENVFGVGFIYSIVYIEHEKKIYKIYSRIVDEEQEKLDENLQSLNLILSTFRFLE